MPNNSTKRLPVSVQIQETLYKRIVDGYYSPGEWLPAERELAEELAVSRPMVRAALTELHQRGFIEREPHCRPRVPESVVPQKTDRHAASQTIAAILPQQPSYATAHSILRGITRELRQHESPCAVTVLDTHQEKKGPASKPWEIEILERLLHEPPVAGIIIWHYMGEETVPILRRIQKRGTPIVFVDRLPGEMDCDYVGVDNRGGMRQGIEYLLRLGHRRFALLMDNPHISAVREREAGFRDALWNAGILPDERLIRHAFQHEHDIRHDLTALFEQPEPPTALVASNDLTAFAIMQAAVEKGWRIPQDFSLIGFDDIECSSPHPAILTTIHQPFFEVGQQAVALLLDRLRHPERTARRTYRQMQLATSLVVRSTCGAPPC